MLTFVSMEQTNQDELRERAKRRCTPQKVIANRIGITNVFFNTFLRGKRNLSEKTANKLDQVLEE